MSGRFLLPVEENYLMNEAMLTKHKIGQIEEKYDKLKRDLEIAKLNKGSAQSELTVKEIEAQMLKLKKEYKIAVANMVTNLS
jgi:hypothetical protein